MRALRATVGAAGHVRTLLMCVAVVAGLLVMHPLGHHTPAAAQTTLAPAATPTAHSATPTAHSATSTEHGSPTDHTSTMIVACVLALLSAVIVLVWGVRFCVRGLSLVRGWCPRVPATWVRVWVPPRVALCVIRQ